VLANLKSGPANSRSAPRLWKYHIADIWRVRCGAAVAVLIFSLAVAPPGATTPAPLGGAKSDDRIALALRVWICLPSGSFSVASRLPLPIEVDTGDFLAGLPFKAVDDVATPFPAGAQDLQNWIGKGVSDDD
jgi:hypothetical protein